MGTRQIQFQILIAIFLKNLYNLMFLKKPFSYSTTAFHDKKK